MAVEVRYHVIRDGEEVAVYLTKKEADEHDKMLDIAYELSDYIGQAPKITLDEDLLEELTIYLAQNRAEVIRILRAQKPRKPAKKQSEPVPEASDKTPATQGKKTKGKAKAPRRGKRK